ncbi:MULTISPECIES: DUF5799 family protein [Natrialba]|uniref:Uncharacterized protein n=1 Tax=Natrialba swarupiae TaxID=2448032 RepID=A0A5D5ATI9_9EURY|nr:MULTISPECIES: DUF5799 family protein [Natrialba]MWV38301.1 hypothetical protein [Natrialba sp. INN-245]TYT62341.1 hypothetical protein FYC77_08980 [Natrialba swarupiae]
MSESSWTDRIVGERMTVDQEFSSRIQGSEFSNQQWSLIMTATEFEIEHPGDPERAQIVANTDNVDQIIPELENVDARMGAAGAGGSGSGSSSGLIDSIKGSLGLGGGGDDHADQLAAAERLTQEYAEELQSHLEAKGRWDSVRESVVDQE